MLRLNGKLLRENDSLIATNLSVGKTFEAAATLSPPTYVSVYVYYLSGVVATKRRVIHWKKLLQNSRWVRTRNVLHRHF